jgi:hypothetical protein
MRRETRCPLSLGLGVVIRPAVDSRVESPTKLFAEEISGTEPREKVQ